MALARWRAVFAAAACSWVVLIVAAPFAASRPTPRPVADACVFAVYALGSIVCHQRPGRSFHLWAAQLPVCARCTGVYLGAAFAPLLPFRRAAAGVRAALLLAAAAAPTGATLVYEWASGATPSNMVRMAAGLWLGLGVARIIWDALH